MFYKPSSRYARLKAAIVFPSTICIVMFYAMSCSNSAKDENVVTPTTSQSPSVTGANASIPVPPPPPPPPPPVGKAGSSEPDAIYTVVDNMPQYPGGDNARIKYMIENLKYPKHAIENNIQGTVYVTFIVERDGTINEVSLLRGFDQYCDQEALRIVRNMPKWNPGSQAGKPVRVKYNIPIQFRLSNDSKSGKKD